MAIIINGAFKKFNFTSRPYSGESAPILPPEPPITVLDFADEAPPLPNTIGTTDRFATSVATNEDGSVFAMGAPFKDGSVLDSGSVFIARRTGTSTYNNSQILTAVTESNGQNYGGRLALDNSGNTLVVAYTSSINVYGIDVYINTGGSYSLQGSFTVQGSTTLNSSITSSVRISGDGSTIVVGNTLGNSTIGQAHVFRRVENVWTEVAVLTPTGAAGHANGKAVAINSDGTLIGLCGAEANTRAGSAFVYEFNGTTWVLAQSLSLAVPIANSRYGTDMDMDNDGNIVISGWSVDSAKGAVWYWERSESTWTQTRKFQQTTGGWRTGWRVAISGDGNVVAAGAPEYNVSNPSGGAILIFDLTGVDNTQSTIIESPTTEFNEQFGNAFDLSYSGRYLVVGSDRADANGADSGNYTVYKTS